MTVDAAQLRLAAFVMVAAFVSSVALGFFPSFRERRAHPRAVRGQAEVPAAVEAGWLGVQAAVILALVAALSAPERFASAPFSLLAYASGVSLAAGTAVFVAGAAVAAMAARSLGEQLTVAIEVRDGGRLATTGPYARVRHPLYTGILLLVAGLALALAAPLLALVLGVAVACANFRAKAEERLLADDPTLGETYRAYLARTGRFFPPRGKGKSVPPVAREP